MEANWDGLAHRVFLDMCIEEMNANNGLLQVLNVIGYADLVSKFSEHIKKKYDCDLMKNKWETLKKHYTIRK